MKISVITVTFNSARTVKDTIESVQAQQFPQVEHIIIDGLSSDNTLPVVRQYSNIAVVVSEKDSGIYDAMNKGIRLASGDVIGILNSDDVYADNNVLNEVDRKSTRLTPVTSLSRMPSSA